MRRQNEKGKSVQEKKEKTDMRKHGEEERVRKDWRKKEEEGEGEEEDMKVGR